jgi:hypothetical protein
MLGRAGVLLVSLAMMSPAAAGEMSAEQARRFVVGKLFAFSCFDGTQGAGRIFADGSVAGTLQAGGGSARFVSLPANTLRVHGQRVCASLSGMPFEPCFNLQQTAAHSFRGSIAGLAFAYCDFTRRGPSRTNFARRGTRSSSLPLPLHACTVGPEPHSREAC